MGCSGFEAHQRWFAGVGEPGAGIIKDEPTGAAATWLTGRTLEEQNALGQHQLGVDAGGDLDRRVVLPRGERVSPTLDAVVP